MNHQESLTKKRPRTRSSMHDASRKECINASRKKCGAIPVHVLDGDGNQSLEDMLQNSIELENPIESEYPMDPENFIEPQNLADTQKSRKTRGATKCKVVATEMGSRIEVQFNGRRQPIGRGSEIFSSFVGNLGREMVPITYDDWRKVPEENKEYFWEAITQKFIVNGTEGKTYTLQLMGRLWRAYKSRLRSSNKPENIESAEWEKFVKNKLSKKFMEKSKKFKQMRSKQDLPYTASRRGYARLEDDMKKKSPNPSTISRVDVWIQAHTKKNGEASNSKVADYVIKMREIKASQSTELTTPSLRNDALSQLLGPERCGRVRGLGAGVTPSKLGAISQNNGNVAKLEEELYSMKEKVVQMDSLINDQKKLIDILMNNQGQHAGSEQMMQSSATPSSNTPQSQPAKINRKGQKCKLMDWMEPNVIVAIGRWVTDDPNTTVHCIPLGKNASRVWVDEIERPEALLWRSTFDMETIDEAKGSSVAWPTDHLVMMND